LFDIVLVLPNHIIRWGVTHVQLFARRKIMFSSFFIKITTLKRLPHTITFGWLQRRLLRYLLWVKWRIVYN